MLQIFCLSPNSLFLVFFSLAIILDHFILNNYLGPAVNKWYLYFRNSFYVYINIVLFIIFLFIIQFLNLPTLDINFKDIFDISLNIADNSDGVNANIGTNATVNINNPHISGKFSKEGINNIAAAISSAGGATAGLKTAQYVGGTPGTKLAIGLGTMMFVQFTTAGMSKVLNHNKGNNINGKGNNLVNNFINNSDNIDSSNILNDYPLNLLIEVNSLLYVAILFMFVFFNIYLSNYLIKINYSKYIPKNNIGNLLNIFINRYISIWNKSKEYLLIISWILLFMTILVTKFFIYTIINFYT